MGGDHSLHVSRVLMGLVQWGDGGERCSARGDRRMTVLSSLRTAHVNISGKITWNILPYSP